MSYIRAQYEVLKIVYCFGWNKNNSPNLVLPIITAYHEAPNRVLKPGKIEKLQSMYRFIINKSCAQYF